MSLIAICGACDRPSRKHPIASAQDVPPCNRLPENIGYSYWFTTEPVRTAKRVTFEQFIANNPDHSREVPVTTRVITETKDQEYSDYFLSGSTVTIAESYSGTAARDYDQREDEDDYFSDWDQYEIIRTPNGKHIMQYRWMDKNPSEYTSVLDYSYRGINNVPYSPGFTPKHDPSAILPLTQAGATTFNTEDEERTAFVEGDSAFIAKRFLDLVLTEAYHNRLLNIFTDKSTGLLRVGGMRIASNFTTHEVTASCVTPQHSCQAATTIDPNSATPDELRWFIYTIIAHGNNHAAPWFTNRASFYKVHHPLCVLTGCPTSVASCPTLRNAPEVTEVLTSWLTDDVVSALSNHVSTCSNLECDCIAALNREVSLLIDNRKEAA